MGKKSRHVSGESAASTDSESNYIPTPPDGGWGWVIVFSSLMCNIIVDGIAYSFGVFIIEFEAYFQESKGKTALIGSLLCGTYLCTGPIASALVNKFGCRPVTMVGSIIGAAAFFCSTFSPNLDALIVLYGIMGGFGFGLIYLPSIVSVGYYFEKKRAVATGVAVAGSGVGTFIFAPFTKFLLDVYDWKGALWIMSGIILNGLVFGALMRPLEAKRHRDRPRKKTIVDRMKEKTRQRQESDARDAAAILEKLQEAKLDRQRQLREEDSESEASWHSNAIHGARIDPDNIDPRVIASVSRQNSVAQRQSVQSGDSDGNTMPRIVVENEEGDEIHDEVDQRALELQPLRGEGDQEKTGRRVRTFSTPVSTENNLKVNGPSSNGKSMVMSESNLHQRQNRVMKFGSDVWSNVVRNVKNAPSQEIKKEDYAKPMYRKDIFYSGSVMNFHQFRSQPDMRSYVTSITAIPVDLPEERSCCAKYTCPCLPKTAADTLREMMDCSLLKNSAFLLICFGNVIGMAGFYVPFVYLADRAVHLGIAKSQAALLLSIIGITNTLGRVLSGVIANIPPIKALQVNNVCLIISAIATIVSPFCVTYVTLCIYAAVFGLCIAAYISLTSIILCDILGLEKLTNAFGLLTLARGISSGFGPPLAGIVYDMTKNYDASFYMGGGMIMGCALLHCLLWLPCFQKHIQSEQQAMPDYLENKSSGSSSGGDQQESNTVV